MLRGRPIACCHQHTDSLLVIQSTAGDMPHGVALPEFHKIQWLTARVTTVKVHKTARVPAYLCSLDVGSSLCEEHQKLHGKSLYFSSAQLTQQHAKEDILEQSLLVVANFPRKQIGPRMSDCLITGVQVDSEDVAERTASTVFVTFSHPVQPGLLVTVNGSEEVLKENARELTWDAFTTADLRVASITDATCQQQDERNSMHDWAVILDFGRRIGLMQGKAALHSQLFESKVDMLDRQVLAVTNLSSQSTTDNDITEAAVLTVGGKALLQPAKKVANGCKLA